MGGWRAPGSIARHTALTRCAERSRLNFLGLDLRLPRDSLCRPMILGQARRVRAGTFSSHLYLMAATGAEEMRGIPAQRRRGEPEKHLVAVARNNDEAAIRSIIRAHNRMLFRIARSILSSDDAEDAVQAAYVRAFTSLSGFRGEARIGTWLGRIVLNEALGRVRRPRPTVTIDALEALPAAEVIRFPLSNPSSDPERTMAQQQIRRSSRYGKSWSERSMRCLRCSASCS
jgi:hypothetical protein